MRQELLDILNQSVVNADDTSQLQAVGTGFISDMLDHIGRKDGLGEKMVASFQPATAHSHQLNSKR